MKTVKVDLDQQPIIEYNPRQQRKRHGLLYWLYQLWNAPFPAEWGNSLAIIAVFLVLLWVFLQR